MTARSPGWRIGRVGSAPLYLAPSWLVVAAILTVVFLPTVRAWAPELSGIAAVGAALCFPLGLFVSVLAHELAHGAMATALKVQVREYVVTFWGGHTSFSAGTLTPGSSAAISFAGPLANLVLGGLGWILLQPMSAGLPAVIVASLTWSNLVVAAFNLLPGSPLDGGQILEAAIWKLTSDRYKGEIGAGWVGRGLAIAIVVVGALVPFLQGSRTDVTQAVWLILIAGVVWNGASNSIKVARARQRGRHFDLRPLLQPSLVVSSKGTLADIPNQALFARASQIVLVDETGWPVAVLDQAALASVPPQVRATTAVQAVATPIPRQSVLTEVTGTGSLQQLAAAFNASATVVAISPHGILGTADRGEVLEALRSMRT